MTQYRAVILVCRDNKATDVKVLMRAGEILGFEVSALEVFETRDIFVRWVYRDVGAEDRLAWLPVVLEGEKVPRFLVNGDG